MPIDAIQFVGAFAITAVTLFVPLNDAIAASTRDSQIDANGRALAGGLALAMGSAVAIAWDPNLLTEAGATGLSAERALLAVLLVVYALLLAASLGVSALHRLWPTAES